MRLTTRSGIALAVGTIALAGVGVLGIGLAGAQTADSDSSATARPPRPELTDAQRQCLADQGLTPPQRPADGTRVAPTDEQRAAFRAAAEACGLPAPPQGGFGYTGSWRAMSGG